MIVHHAADGNGGLEVDEAAGDPTVDVVELGGEPVAGHEPVELEPGEKTAVVAPAPATAGLGELERVVDGGLEPAQDPPRRRRRVAAAGRLPVLPQDAFDFLRSQGELPAPGLVPASRLHRLDGRRNHLPHRAQDDVARRLHRSLN